MASACSRVVSARRRQGAPAAEHHVRWAAGEHALNEFPQQDLFMTIAEVGAAFVGFSMVVGLLRPDSSDRARFHSLRDVAEVSLIAIAAALLPVLVHSFGWSPERTWRFASLAFSVAWLGVTFLAIRRFVRASLRPGAAKVLWFGPTFAVVANALLWWNVLNPDQTAGPRYAVALILLLVFAGLSFIAATFHERGGPAA